MKTEPLTDVREMRKLFVQMRHGRNSFSDPCDFALSANLVRRCFDAAECQGLSGEDAMTLLAYHALQSLDTTQNRLLEMLQTQQVIPMTNAPRSAT